jgi:hypothetical protein
MKSEYLSKIFPENSSFIQVGKEILVLYMETTRLFLSYLAQFFLEGKMFQTRVLCSKTVFESRAVIR